MGMFPFVFFGGKGEQAWPRFFGTCSFFGEDEQGLPCEQDHVSGRSIPAQPEEQKRPGGKKK